MSAKRLKLFISFVFLGTGALLMMSLSSFKQNSTPLSLVRKMVESDLDRYEQAVKRFAVLSEQGTSEEIMTYYSNELRPAFKRCEWVLAYFDAEAYSKWINGAPLPKLEKNVPNPTVIEPNGFQTIDEWMGGDAASLEEIRELASLLSDKSSSLLKYIRSVSWNERHFFEAARSEVLRLFTLGITGFDSPGTLSSMKDAGLVYEVLHDFLGCYGKEGENQWKEGYLRLIASTAAGKEMLLQSDFKNLDRAALYKQSLQPLYAGIYRFQKQLGVETEAEVDNSTAIVNPDIEQLFDQRFLNTTYYMEMPIHEKQQEREKLGKLLFFDPVLSFNAERACASCHQPGHGFAEERAKSLANEKGKTIKRNAPGLINAVYAQDFFYDLRSGRLQDQIEHVVFSHDEFNLPYDSILDRLNSSVEYVQLFQEAYPELGPRALSQYSINVSLAAYVSTLVDWNSPFDRYMRSEADLSPDAIAGFNLFMGKAACATCHFPPTFSGLVPPQYEENESEVLGITTHADFKNPLADSDPGRYASGKPVDKYPFYQNSMKTTSVRNAELTAPYMHNGSLNTLEEVLEFYNLGGGAGMGLDVQNQTLPADPLDLSETELQQLIAFIKSLSNNPFNDQGIQELPELADKRFKGRIPAGVY